MFIIVHWIACAWYILVTGEDNEKWIPAKDLDFYYTNFYQSDIYYQYIIVFHSVTLTMLGNECAPATLA